MLLRRKANRVIIFVFFVFVFITIILPATNFDRRGRVFSKLLPFFIRSGFIYSKFKFRGNLLLRNSKDKDNLLFNLLRGINDSKLGFNGGGGLFSLLFNFFRRINNSKFGLSGLFNLLKKINDSFKNFYFL